MKKKRSLLLVSALFALILFSITSYAYSEYEMYDCWWEDQAEDGRIFGSWEKCDAKTSYKVRLTYGNSHKLVKDWYSGSSSGTNDFTSYIAKKGSGTYYFDVFPTKGGEEYMVSSEGLEVTSSMVSKAKKYLKDEAAERQAAMYGWMKGPDGNWRFYKTGGVACKNEWLDDGGKRYHFDSNSIMQTGWQVISGYWYYFDQSGAMYINAVTPDGYWVNAEGKYVDANGNPVLASGNAHGSSSSASSGSARTLSSISISVSEQNKVAGQVITANFKAGSGFDIVNEALSIPREQWTAGTSVSVTLKCVPKSGYIFSSGTIKANVNGASNIQVSGGASERTVKFTYRPKMKLATPIGFCFNENMELTWKKSDKASGYKLVFYLDNSQKATKNVNTNKLEDVYEYLDMGRYEGTVSVKVYATNSEKSSYLLTSDAGVIDDLTMLEESMGMGGFSWEGNRLYYYDEAGEKLKGWQYIDSYWYHFKNNGAADGPGWYHDSDGCWYWFDSMCRMCIGTINDGKTDYFMNDGSNPNLPYGAWKE
ncbi:MAG: hypothetical protein MJ059_01485 [Lachnospiraceae bacterium]|nr:hypothetical protein [Lachnospiraceae bacterium]